MQKEEDWLVRMRSENEIFTFSRKKTRVKNGGDSLTFSLFFFLNNAEFKILKFKKVIFIKFILKFYRNISIFRKYSGNR